VIAPIGRHLAKPSSDANALRAIDSGREGFCGTVDHRSYGSNAALCRVARSLPFTLPPTAAPHPPGIAAAGIRALGRSSWDGVGRAARRDRSGAQPLPWGQRRFSELHQRLQGGAAGRGRPPRGPSCRCPASAPAAAPCLQGAFRRRPRRWRSGLSIVRPVPASDRDRARSAPTIRCAAPARPAQAAREVVGGVEPVALKAQRAASGQGEA
jgi:hypothetical protein